MNIKKGRLTLCFLLYCFFGWSQSTVDQLLDSTDVFLQQYVFNGYVNYQKIKKDQSITDLIKSYQNLSYTTLDDPVKKAMLINAYNLKVIEKIVADYPTLSVQAIPRFFLKEDFLLDQNLISINDLEKKYLFAIFDDPRLHFALVCGAKGCPPIHPQAYRPESLEIQLEQITRAIVNDPYFVRLDEDRIYLFKVLEWYEEDFVDEQTTIIQYLNKYRDTPISENTKVKYRKYDWSLNALVDDLFGGEKAGNSSLRYVVSSTIPKKGWEIKWFNNLYSQSTENNRSSFFTSTLNILYGLSDRFNIGATGRLRRVKNQTGDSKAFDLFKPLNASSDRQELSGIGPLIRWAAVPQWSHFSIQSSLLIPLDSDLSGKNFMQPYVDYDGLIWNTQLFNDLTINNKFSVFTEIDFLMEDIGKESSSTRISTPMIAILSYFPFRNFTLYALASYSPYYEDPVDYFYQLGIGTKYQFSLNYEVELLYSYFDNKSLKIADGEAATYNLGIRYSY